MCGIVGYIGPGNICNVLLEGLRRLEYRGYDSAGIAYFLQQKLNIRKTSGKVSDLVKLIQQNPLEPDTFCAGIAHTRWATHGAPTPQNAHPHTCHTQTFACVHNGIIENYRSLREQLEKKGHVFSSETDSEVIPHLIYEFYEGDILAAVATALKQLRGTFGLAIISTHDPTQIIAARRGSPIVIGVGTQQAIVASDVSAVIRHTNNVIYLDDHDIAVIKANDINICNIDRVPVSRKIDQIDWQIEDVEKGGYPHYMLKEIFEQPEALYNSIRGRLDHESGTAILSGLNMTPQDLVKIQRVILAACGTSYHAGLVGEYYFEELADINTEVEQASEFRYRNPILDGNCLVVTISQSGETADTLAALREAKSKGAVIAGLCNVVGSTIAREAGRGVYLHAGPEIGVASTKAFTCQTAVLWMMALKFARARRMPLETGQEIAQQIEALPTLVSKVLDRADQIERLAKQWAHVNNAFFIGRGILYPVALEGALKLKEISYIHAEGYHAAELKHGPIALLDPNMLVVALLNEKMHRDKTLGNVQECLARHAPVLAIAQDGDEVIQHPSCQVIHVPCSTRYQAPFTAVVVCQLLSYFIARERGCPIDQPRNLAKSVTVE